MTGSSDSTWWGVHASGWCWAQGVSGAARMPARSVCYGTRRSRSTTWSARVSGRSSGSRWRRVFRPSTQRVRATQYSARHDAVLCGAAAVRPRQPVARIVWEAGYGAQLRGSADAVQRHGNGYGDAEVVALDRGPVVPAIEASIALPFVARPPEIGGRYYVDGGMLETAPVHVARRMGAELVIAICLGGNLRAPTVVRNRPWVRTALERIGSSGRPGSGSGTNSVSALR